MSSNNADRELMEALLQFDNILATKTVSPIAQFHAARQMDAPRMRRIGRLSEQQALAPAATTRQCRTTCWVYVKSRPPGSSHGGPFMRL
jgi:hypothetical protein